MPKIVEVKLEECIRINGVDCDIVTLQAPSYSHRVVCNSLKQKITQALCDQPSTTISDEQRLEAEKTSDLVFDGDIILMAIQRSSIDYAQFVRQTEDVIQTCAYVSIPAMLLTEGFYAKLSADDAEKIVGKFIENFLISSHFLTMLKN